FSCWAREPKPRAAVSDDLLRSRLKLWFTLLDPVDRRTYLANGLGLMALKYGVDAAGVGLVTGRFWSPLDYLLPFWFLRTAKLAGAPGWFFPALVLWTLPFLWARPRPTSSTATARGGREPRCRSYPSVSSSSPGRCCSLRSRASCASRWRCLWRS